LGKEGNVGVDHKSLALVGMLHAFLSDQLFEYSKVKVPSTNRESFSTTTWDSALIHLPEFFFPY